MEYKYTLDEVVKKLKERDMYVPSMSALSTLITKNNFYARGFGVKELNGYKNGDTTGKRWYLNDEGVELLIDLTKGIRHRRTKQEMLNEGVVEQLKIGNALYNFKEDGSMSYRASNFEEQQLTFGMCILTAKIDEDLLNYMKMKSKILDKDISRILEEIIKEDMKKTFIK